MGFLSAIPMIGGLLDKLLGRFFADKNVVESNANSEQTSFRSQVATEAAIAPTNRWNSFVTGLNRLVRPFYTFGVGGLFVWACWDPITFSASMAALQLIPEPLWIIMGTIVVFWFGGGTLEGMKATSISPKGVQAVAGQIAAIRALSQTFGDPEPAIPAAAAGEAEQTQRGDEREQARGLQESGVVMDPADYDRAMGSDAPLPLPAIVEWNRRRQGGSPDARRLPGSCPRSALPRSPRS